MVPKLKKVVGVPLQLLYQPEVQLHVLPNGLEASTSLQVK